MATQIPIDSLDALCNGALTERFNTEFAKFLRNLVDPNTDAKKKRKLILILEATPNADRDFCVMNYDVQTKLAAPSTISQTVFLTQNGNGEVIASQVTNQIPGQIDMDGNETPLPQIVNLGKTAKAD